MLIILTEPTRNVTVANDPTDPRNDPDLLVIPFIFVPDGAPPPLRWLAEHPDYIKVPAVMVPAGSPPPRRRR
jgi:hypothetical protein